MKFSIKDFFSKCDKIRRKLWISQFSADFITFTGEILNGKIHILCSDGSPKHILKSTSFFLMELFDHRNLSGL